MLGPASGQETMKPSPVQAKPGQAIVMACHGLTAWSDVIKTRSQASKPWLVVSLLIDHTQVLISINSTIMPFHSYFLYEILHLIYDLLIRM